MDMLLSVDFSFCAAHHLPFYDGPCKRLHGHNYQLRVTLTGRPSPKDGMIRDFDEIKRTVWELCLVECDHHNLQQLQLWETPEYCVTYKR